MYLRDFQICMRHHVHETYGRLCQTWDPLELQIRKDIPRRFIFGGVKKMVLELGSEPEPRPKYRVLLDTGLYHVPEFDPQRYLLLPPEQQRAQIAGIVRASMTELAERFGAPIDWLIDSIARTNFRESP